MRRAALYLIALGVGALIWVSIARADKIENDKLKEFRLVCVRQADLLVIPSFPFPFRGYICIDGEVVFVPQRDTPMPHAPRTSPKTPVQSPSKPKIEV